VRAAATGISAIVDPYGRVVAATALRRPDLLVADVRTSSARTPYARIGDAFATACLLVAAAACRWRRT
jgi:apolipoprotein N-acyltransferase